MIAQCQRETSEITLLALRDDALPPSEAARLREHVHSCAACAAYLHDIADDARLLRQQPVPREMQLPQMQDRMWRDLHHRIVNGRERIYPHMHISRAAALRSLGAIAAIVIIAVLVVQGMQWVNARRQALIGASTNTHPLQILTDNAITATLPNGFVPVYISPDGNTLIGIINQSWDPGALTAIGRYTVATKKFDLLTGYMKMIQYVSSDGRYISWVVGDGQNTKTSQTEKLEVLDLQTLRKQTIASKTGVFPMWDWDFLSEIDHGMLIWQQSADANTTASAYQPGLIEVTNLATGTTTKVSAPFLMQTLTISWPNILFAGRDDGGNIVEQFANITTGQITQLPKSPAPNDSFSPGSNSASPQRNVGYVIQGTTVFATWVTSSGSFEVAQLDHAATAASSDDWKTIMTMPASSTFKGTSPSISVNDRFIVFEGNNPEQTLAHGGASQTAWLIWDRDLHRFLQFPESITGNDLGYVYASGNWLVVSRLTSNEVNAGSPPPASTIWMFDSNTLHFKQG
jgi:predicted anti-sigma-YlaC factor YlaD